ncbi:acyl-CoA dehydratase activase [Pseudothermotoga thermarum]|uniref:CoA-substrate-specific enzyme activase n=1 Tax=Pseudothermotoga thermarum DSM 5069 TaxID=688269 RepID=F7YUV4_9THEM|nr:acyl-CoA dehydratase activase [Pseudothermotoga thermarum]AEH51514.1 CoA-substrate-specific enzyme activase [Pseudothermotoga thermarum DSM 5069]
MIIYNCPRVPFEFFMCLDIPYRRVEIKGCEFENFHPNVCSFCRRTIADLPKDAVLFWIDSCDSMRRSVDFLTKTHSVFTLHLPTVVNQHSKEKLKKDLEVVLLKLEKFFGKKVSREKLLEVQKKLYEDIEKLEQAVYQFRFEEAKVLYERITGSKYVGPMKNHGKPLIVLGSPVDENFIRIVEENKVLPINATCSGPLVLFSQLEYTKDPFENIALRLLGQRLFCARSLQERQTEWIFEKFKTNLAVIHTVKFCDFYWFDEMQLKSLNVKFVTVENDFSMNHQQIKTRLEALIEMEKGIERRESKTKYYVGIDSGSTTTKIAVLDENKNLLYKEVVKTGAYPVKVATMLFEKVLSKLKISREEAFVVATGYGRSLLDFADLQVTEITCHAKGVREIFPNVKTIIDIGGQDSKVIKLEDGQVKDFVMNDKCAAGTGRFLEVMAHTLEVPIEKIGEVALFAKENLSISSVCTVFAESEVISLRSSGHKVEDILKAVHMAIAKRLIAMYGRVNGESPVVLTGGVAKNIAIKKCLEELLNTSIQVPQDPTVTGALGAAVIGLETCLKRV